MSIRSELESRILKGVLDLKTIELALDRRLGDLAMTRTEEREAFLRELTNLEAKANRLDQFLDQIDASYTRDVA